MIEDLNIMLITGGFNVCHRTWNKAQTEIDKCYKLYLPVKGSGYVVLDGADLKIKVGEIYLFSGYDLDRQYCEDELDVYWLHFIPESLQLRHFLSQISAFHAWPSSMNPFGKRIYSTIERLFKLDQNAEQANKYMVSAHVCEINALILHLVADLLQHVELEDDDERRLSIDRLQPSLDFIDGHIYKPLSLDEIASKSNLSPNYFHRQFKELFGVTPLVYITERRISAARRMLSTTNLPIREIAYRLGYHNEYYFSRLFRRELEMTPSEFRKSGSSL